MASEVNIDGNAGVIKVEDIDDEQDQADDEAMPTEEVVQSQPQPPHDDMFMMFELCTTSAFKLS